MGDARMWFRATWRGAGAFTAVACLLGAATAHADRTRFHILSKALGDRIAKAKPLMQARLASVGLYRRKSGRTGGTAFLVDDPRGGSKTLVLTANHVALYEKKTVAGDTVVFYPHGADASPSVARVLRVVAADKDVDYALLEVELPPAMHGQRAAALSATRPDALDEGQRLYNPSFPKIWKDEKQAGARRLVAGAIDRATYKGAITGLITPKMLQVGAAQGFTVQGFEVASLPQQNGSSGSPVFDTKTHRLVGMLTAGGGLDTAMIRPTGAIVADLATHIRLATAPSAPSVTPDEPTSTSR